MEDFNQDSRASEREPRTWSELRARYGGDESPPFKFVFNIVSVILYGLIGNVISAALYVCAVSSLFFGPRLNFILAAGFIGVIHAMGRPFNWDGYGGPLKECEDLK